MENQSKESILIMELMAKLDAERRKNSKLEEKLSQLKDPSKNQTFYQEQLKEKDAIISKQQELITQMRSRINYLLRKEWGKSSERNIKVLDDGQLIINFQGFELTQEEQRAYQEAQEEAKLYHKRRLEESKKRHSQNKPVRKILPENLRREVIDMYPDGYLGHEDEWTLLPDSFNDITEILERKPAEYYVKQIVRHKAIRLSDIERTIHNSTLPSLPISKSYAGASVLASLMVGKYADHIPFYRQIEMIKRLGVNLPPSTINNWFLDVADLCRPLYYHIREKVLKSQYIQADETTIPIANKVKGKTIKGYLWQTLAVLDNLLFFHYDYGSRSKDVAIKLYAGYRGAMQTDGYTVYNIFEKQPGILCLSCWTHARRYFDRSFNNDDARAQYAIDQIRLLYNIEAEADSKNMNYDERRALRSRISLPILNHFEQWLRAEYPKVLPKSPIGKAIAYTLSHIDRLSRYTIDGKYRIDSNLVENNQRPVAVGRKGYLFCGNDDAAEDAAVMYTIMGCCRLAGVDVEKYFTYFLEHVHDYDSDYSKDLCELLPSRLNAAGLI